MSYQKTNWVSNKTVISADNLNKIENQLELLSSANNAPDANHEAGSYQIEGEDTIIYRVKRKDEDSAPYTVLEVASPNHGAGQDSEATLTLMRTMDGESGGVEFVDIYNNGYTDSRQAGIRVQSRGTGQLRDFVFDFFDGKQRFKTLVVKPELFEVRQPIDFYGGKLTFRNANGELGKIHRMEDRLAINNFEAGSAIDLFDNGNIVQYQPTGDTYIYLDEGNFYINDKLAQVVDAGTARPQSVPTGYQFFDTTLGKPIWFNGTEWVDATGATV